MLTPESWSLALSAGVFLAAATVVGIVGTRITGVVDQLADRTGLGEALAGAVLLGASTSLADAVLSVSAAWHGRPDLAISNALGGIAVQTVFLAVADMVYRRANLEHAAASPATMMQASLLITLLGLILLAPLLPGADLGIHPVTPFLVLCYLYGITLIRQVRAVPLWRAAITAETRPDTPADPSSLPSLRRLATAFVVLMLLLGAGGWLLERAAVGLTVHTPLGETAVGVIFTGFSTSLPELVTSVAAVRRGALTLAIGGVVGGNAFDTLTAAASDVAYREASIYHAISEATLFWVVLALLMSGVLMMGLVRREEQGIGNIGFESTAILALYLLGIVLLFR